MDEMPLGARFGERRTSHAPGVRGDTFTRRDGDEELGLDTDALAVESFHTADIMHDPGTVHGAEAPATRTSCGGFPECTCPPPTV